MWPIVVVAMLAIGGAASMINPTATAPTVSSPPPQEVFVARQAPGPSFPFTPVQVVTGVPRVLDGDTVVVAGVHVRLNGVDAEELDEPHGPMARAALQGIVGVGAPLRCGLNGERTRDREVGVCLNTLGQDIGAEIIRNGLALDCFHFSKGRYRSLEPNTARDRLRSKPYCR